MTTINIERLQGRRYASEVITSVLQVSDAFFDHRGALETVRDNLAETAKSRQAEFAAGIHDILEMTR